MTRALNVPANLVGAAMSKRRSADPIIAADNQPARQPSRPKRGKIAVYMDIDQIDRVRGAYAALPAAQRPPSLSQWIAALVLAETSAIEKTTNVEPLGRGHLRKGAPFKT